MPNESPPPPPAAAVPPDLDASHRGPAAPLFRSAERFRDSREVIIEHAGAWYRLRLTQSNKLILTK
jgi:hemin uptake protein HemP